MVELSWPAYLGILTLSALTVLAVTPLLLRFAVRRSILDRPGGHKAHDDPVPYLGGLGIVLAFAILVLVLALIGQTPAGLRELGIILALGVLLATVGLIDDLRGLGPWLRLAVQIGVGVALWLSGVGVELFGVTAVDASITVFWVVGVVNSFNLLDNMDGLSAGIAAIAALSFFVIASLNGQYLVAALAVALAGCALGFLRHNFHPARIYMGDAGSLFLGFVLAVIGIKLRFESPTQLTFFVPILVLGVAIFDTTLVTSSRIINGRNPLAGGRDHVSHRLVFVGIPVPVAVSLIYAGGASLGWLALVMSRLDVTTGFLLMGFVIVVAVFLGILLALVPVYAASTRRRLMIQEVQRNGEARPAGEPQHGDERHAVEQRRRP